MKKNKPSLLAATSLLAAVSLSSAAHGGCPMSVDPGPITENPSEPGISDIFDTLVSLGMGVGDSTDSQIVKDKDKTAPGLLCI
ncbi:hypothetical protein [Pseudobacteriovorax antillogorgiicola]|uniref:Secreted protein n=1 Tax=Pseudobacteriovorax antillogorgiicola TaxID=1513793 RepID=A0A1Y6BBT6_9BACT|nr:hypothetical protein [Pseudobacteriovorax antillogorgiicola]TCS57556.1 hypothetical protein EDD56_103296 [Pseudobacteriovorax antillogorgiicola]SME99789.1 hypothetical protein SAMN06296036_10337 [Pseudobacteriovorax antillogorgiicola]